MNAFRICCSVLLIASSVVGCATHDRRDAPWDPPPGQALFEVLPNWDHKALRQCGGHLRPDQRRPGMTDRC